MEISQEQLAGLTEGLKQALSATDAYEYLLQQSAELMEMASSYRAKSLFDPIAVLEFAGKIETTILASGHDQRFIRMCKVMIDLAGIGKDEIAINSDGNVIRRQVYVAQNSLGAIKIGSSMDVEERLRALRTGASEKLTLIGSIDGSTPLEFAIHNELKEFRKDGEWFYPTEMVISKIKRFLGHRLINEPIQPVH